MHIGDMEDANVDIRPLAPVVVFGIRVLTVLYGLAQLFFATMALVAPARLEPSTDPAGVAHVASYLASRNLPVALIMFVLATRRWDRVHGMFFVAAAATQAMDAIYGLRHLAHGGHDLGAAIAPAILTVLLAVAARSLLRASRPALKAT